MKLLRFLLLAISLTTILFARAYDFEANGLYFDLVSPVDLTCALAEGPSPYTGALVIPDVVEYSGKQLKVIRVNCTLPQVSSVQFGKNITQISNSCFSDNQQITSITIPSTLKTIGGSAFSGCTSLTTVKWEGDMILSEYIFSGCSNLKNLSYKSICKDIPPYAFDNCSSLIFDLSEIEQIGRRAFRGCKSLNKIDLSSIKSRLKWDWNESKTRRTGGQFANCGNISLFILGSKIDEICEDLWENCSIDSLVLASSNKGLDIMSESAEPSSQSAYHFNNVSLKGLYLGRNINQPPKYYVTSCMRDFNGSNVKYVTVGSSVSHLGDLKNNGISYGYFFANCKNLCNITFEGTSIKIGYGCFNQTSIKEINFPDEAACGLWSLPEDINVLSFGEISMEDDMSRYTSLTHLISRSSNPKFCSIPKGFSNQQYVSIKVFVPYGAKEAYQNTEPWKNFWNIEEMPGVATERIEITPTNTKLQVGDSLQLTGIRYPENSVDPIQWKSSDIKVATVSDAGLVKAIALGKVTITATSGKASATCEVTVSPIAAQKIILDKDKVSVNVADSIKITATVQPENTTDKTIIWSSSDEKIATVSKDGIIKSIKVGTATITAVCGDVKASCEVTVLPITAEKIVLDLTEVSLNQSDTIKITATITPENTTDKTITWSSSDEKIANVSTDGIIRAIKVGTATITAACGEVKATCEVTVLPVTSEKIVLDLTEVSLNQSDTIKITATITPENTTDKTITWSSSDEKVATVSTDGIITAVGVGKSTIMASCGEISTTCEVTVLEPNIGTDFADNKLTVTVEGSGKPVEISIYSVMGQCVFHKTVEAAVTVKDEIDLSSLSAGTYIVHIISGEINTSKRIVK